MSISSLTNLFSSKNILSNKYFYQIVAKEILVTIKKSFCPFLQPFYPYFFINLESSRFVIFSCQELPQCPKTLDLRTFSSLQFYCRARSHSQYLYLLLSSFLSQLFFSYFIIFPSFSIPECQTHASDLVSEHENTDEFLESQSLHKRQRKRQRKPFVTIPETQSLERPTCRLRLSQCQSASESSDS